MRATGLKGGCRSSRFNGFGVESESATQRVYARSLGASMSELVASKIAVVVKVFIVESVARKVASKSFVISSETSDAISA